MSVPNPSQDDLAWDLLDAVRTGLNIRDINRVSVFIAGRDYVAVVEILLSAVVTTQATLSAGLCWRLDQWLRSYTGHSRAARLQRLLERVTCDCADRHPGRHRPNADVLAWRG